MRLPLLWTSLVHLLCAGANADSEGVFGALGGALRGVEGVFVHDTRTESTTTTATGTTTTTPTSRFLIEEDVDLPGNDLRAVQASSAEACQQECLRADGCIAFTWRKRDRSEAIEGLSDMEEFLADAPQTTVSDAEACLLKGAKPRRVLTKLPDKAATSGYLRDTAIEAPLPHSSLLCFAVVRLNSYEQVLMKVQYDSGRSIFACDEYAVLSNAAEEVVPGVITRVINSSTMAAQFGGTFYTALNTHIFLAAWDRIVVDGRYALHDWTAKADPDSVFFPDRLREVVVKYTDPTTYFTNCRYGLHGPLEVFSGGAVDAFKRGKPRCLDRYQREPWGEDLFMDKCLEMLEVVRHIELESLLVEDHCDPPVGWQNCRNGRVAALHPFKSEEEWRACAVASEQASEYTWVEHPGYSLAGFQTVEMMNSADIDAIKHHVEMRGYVGFVLQGSEASLKAWAPVPDMMGWLARTAGDEVTYLLGLPNISDSPPSPPEPAGDGQDEPKDTECLVQAEPVYRFWSDRTQSHTFHFAPPWIGEVQDGLVFFAFRGQVVGSQPVFDFQRQGRSVRVFHMGVPNPREEIGRIQFYAYPDTGADRERVSSFWHATSADVVIHTGNASDGEELLGEVFFAPAGALKAPAMWPEQCHPCFQADGAVWVPTMAGEAVSTEPSAVECQRRCASTTGCAYFSFDLTRRWCSLSYGYATLRPNLPGTIRGTAACNKALGAEMMRKDAETSGPASLLLAAPLRQVWLPAVAMLLAGLGYVAHSRIFKAKIGARTTAMRLIESEDGLPDLMQAVERGAVEQRGLE